MQVLQAAEKPESDYLSIGSYSPAASEGLALYRLDQETAEVERVSGLAGILNPSFLTPNPENGWPDSWERMKQPFRVGVLKPVNLRWKC